MAETANPQELSGIAANLAAVRARLVRAARSAGRDPATVGLVAISKTQPGDIVAAALDAGQRLFGENRVQEAQAKYPALKARYHDLRLHLVGPLQSNKAADAVALFDAIETVDRPRLAEALARAMERQGKRPACFIQVNTGAETQKAGVAPEAADSFIAQCRTRWNLPVEGLICVPPVSVDPAPHFSLLADIAARNGLRQLSMGMSGDFEIAIAHGATLIRIGTAIFGSRG
jgi:pyridoxal phosphate enzyme (YggS family)